MKSNPDAERKIEEALRSGATDLDLGFMNPSEVPDLVGELPRVENFDPSSNQLKT